MPRWGPDADNRLYLAAMELIFERGYDAVTVAEIAEHAGLKKRSFFRHFADKREVMFAGAADLENTIVEAVRAAPATARPVDVVMTALSDGGAGLARWGEPVRRRQRVVESSTELRERELIKLESLASAIAEALERREVDAFTAILVAKAGVAAFAAAFRQWVEAGEPADFPEIMADAHRRLRKALCEGG
ncbi:helix-turn-helix domain-containing protein [Umezawaea sp. Da 62-37]|uniref:TetR/AcrR family transcriptional regulator n=1 Tax=Umezawaea sp. Da 62-37 TaxID=3075927 RepID=UPI0028F727AD|nr:helix-turn-helix domain-containing protein [Umezawaea sp. Da 62-37]WNV86085.1 helix-turn-helix domain-containing protein [Umezawaea sp. Da 62-37]